MGFPLLMDRLMVQPIVSRKHPTYNFTMCGEFSADLHRTSVQAVSK
jgi:hypothetical protein